MKPLFPPPHLSLGHSFQKPAKETLLQAQAGEEAKQKTPRKHQQQPNKNLKKHSICLKLMQALTLLSPNRYTTL